MPSSVHHVMLCWGFSWCFAVPSPPTGTKWTIKYGCHGDWSAELYHMSRTVCVLLSGEHSCRASARLSGILVIGLGRQLAKINIQAFRVKQRFAQECMHGDMISIYMYFRLARLVIQKILGSHILHYAPSSFGLSIYKFKFSWLTSFLDSCALIG